MLPSALSSPLQIELRVSRLLRVALLLLSALAMVALLLSQAAWLALLAVPLLLGLAWPRRVPGRARALVFRADGSSVGIGHDGDEEPIVVKQLQRRGPLTVLSVRCGGQWQRYVFMPDTLTRAERRHLGLWFDRHCAVPQGMGVAAHV